MSYQKFLSTALISEISQYECVEAEYHYLKTGNVAADTIVILEHGLHEGILSRTDRVWIPR